MPVLLEAGGLTIRRGRRTVLSGVALAVDPGRAIHVAGANGSGKTSLLRVLADLAAPRGDASRHAACAFVPEKARLAPALRCGEWLRAMRALRGLTATDWDAAAGASGLDGRVLDRPAATLSRGMLQRIALLEALESGCPLLLLDEPFSGVDDEGRMWLGAQVAERLEAGAAVLLTDHSGSAAGRVALTDVLRLRDGAALGHLSCAALGGAVGVLFAPPRLTRRATAIAAVIAALLALVAVSAALGPAGGPVAFAQAEAVARRDA